MYQSFDKMKCCMFAMFSGLFLLTSCVSYQTVAVILPDETGVREWNNGKETLIKTSDGNTCSVAFDSSNDAQLIFHVSISSGNDMPVTIDPVAARYYSTVNGENIFMNAYNPEDVILDVRNSIKSEERSYAVSTGLTLAVGLLSLAANDKNFDTDDELDEERKNHLEQMNLLENRLAFWETKALRKTTLHRNETVKGFLVFNKNQEKMIKMIIPVGNTFFTYKYTLETIEIR